MRQLDVRLTIDEEEPGPGRLGTLSRRVLDMIIDYLPGVTEVVVLDTSVVPPVEVDRTRRRWIESQRTSPVVGP